MVSATPRTGHDASWRADVRRIGVETTSPSTCPGPPGRSEYSSRRAERWEGLHPPGSLVLGLDGTSQPTADSAITVRPPLVGKPEAIRC